MAPELAPWISPAVIVGVMFYIIKIVKSVFTEISFLP